MRIICFFLLALAIRPVYSQTPAECDTDALSIYYVNGMFNDKRTVFTSLGQLARRVDQKLELEGRSESFRRNINYEFSLNEGEAWYLQILEVARQAEKDVYSQFWGWLSDIESAPDWFKDIVVDKAGSITNTEFIIDDDLNRHVTAYRAAISEKIRAILVSHSQGNFYANNAVDEVKSPSINMVSVATPAGRVAKNGPYTTLTSDLIITASIGLNPTRLSPNTTNSNSGTDIGHDFVLDYLYGIQSNRKITDDIYNHIENTPSPCDAPEIVSLSFPATMANAPGTLAAGSIDFRDGNGDLMQLCNTLISGPGSSFCVEPENVAGVNEGTIPLEWYCSDNVPFCGTGEVVVDATLVDATGNVSQPYRYSFTVVQGSAGKQSGAGAPVILRSR